MNGLSDEYTAMHMLYNNRGEVKQKMEKLLQYL